MLTLSHNDTERLLGLATHIEQVCAVFESDMNQFLATELRDTASIIRRVLMSRLAEEVVR